jgi:hypothetical protein
LLANGDRLVRARVVISAFGAIRARAEAAALERNPTGVKRGSDRLRAKP